MPTTSKSGRAAKRVDPAIVSAVAREVTPKLVRALQSAVSLTAYEAVEHALAERDRARLRAESLDRPWAPQIPAIPVGVGVCAVAGSHAALPSQPSQPELLAALDRIEQQLDRVSNGTIDLSFFAERLTGASVPTGGANGPNAVAAAGTVSRAWELGDRVSRIADRLAEIAQHLNKAA